MFKKFFKSVSEKLFNASKKSEPPQEKKPQVDIPAIQPKDAPKQYYKPKTVKLGKNQAKRLEAIKALGKTRKQLREARIHVRPKVARLRASRQVA